MKHFTLVLQPAWNPLSFHLTLTLQALFHQVQGLQTHFGLCYANFGDHDRGLPVVWLNEFLGIAPEKVVVIIYRLLV